jgi:hypothetical protein
MLQKIIKNIRAKPEPIRRGITLGVSLFITAIFGFFWLISFLNYSSKVLTSESNPNIETPTGFISKMGVVIGESFSNIKATVGNTSQSLFDADFASSTNAVNNGDASTVGNMDATSASTSTDATVSTNTQDEIELQDILTTKKKDNQENKATTSSEVLVQ